LICDLCKENIETGTERYVNVQDWDSEEKIKSIWCHLKCFNKGMNSELKTIHEQSKGMLKKAMSMMGDLKDITGHKDEEVVHI